MPNQDTTSPPAALTIPRLTEYHRRLPIAVAIAQSAERQIVILEVTGSIPVSHPSSPSADNNRQPSGFFMPTKPANAWKTPPRSLISGWCATKGAALRWGRTGGTELGAH
jgi:hypothetical protein